MLDPDTQHGNRTRPSPGWIRAHWAGGSCWLSFATLDLRSLTTPPPPPPHIPQILDWLRSAAGGQTDEEGARRAAHSLIDAGVLVALPAASGAGKVVSFASRRFAVAVLQRPPADVTAIAEPAASVPPSGASPDTMSRQGSESETRSASGSQLSVASADPQMNRSLSASLDDGASLASPLQGLVSVSITSTERREGAAAGGGAPFVVYCVRVTLHSHPRPVVWTLFRRYSEFLELHRGVQRGLQEWKQRERPMHSPTSRAPRGSMSPALTNLLGGSAAVADAAGTLGVVGPRRHSSAASAGTADGGDWMGGTNAAEAQLPPFPAATSLSASASGLVGALFRGLSAAVVGGGGDGAVSGDTTAVETRRVALEAYMRALIALPAAWMVTQQHQPSGSSTTTSLAGKKGGGGPSVSTSTSLVTIQSPSSLAFREGGGGGGGATGISLSPPLPLLAVFLDGPGGELAAAVDAARLAGAQRMLAFVTVTNARRAKALESSLAATREEVRSMAARMAAVEAALGLGPGVGRGHSDSGSSNDVPPLKGELAGLGGGRVAGIQDAAVSASAAAITAAEAVPPPSTPAAAVVVMSDYFGGAGSPAAADAVYAMGSLLASASPASVVPTSLAAVLLSVGGDRVLPLHRATIGGFPDASLTPSVRVGGSGSDSAVNSVLSPPGGGAIAGAGRHLGTSLQQLHPTQQQQQHSLASLRGGSDLFLDAAAAYLAEFKPRRRGTMMVPQQGGAATPDVGAAAAVSPPSASVPALQFTPFASPPLTPAAAAALLDWLFQNAGDASAQLPRHQLLLNSRDEQPPHGHLPTTLSEWLASLADASGYLLCDSRPSAPASSSSGGGKKTSSAKQRDNASSKIGRGGSISGGGRGGSSDSSSAEGRGRTQSSSAGSGAIAAAAAAAAAAAVPIAAEHRAVAVAPPRRASDVGGGGSESDFSGGGGGGGGGFEPSGPTHPLSLSAAIMARGSAQLSATWPPIQLVPTTGGSSSSSSSSSGNALTSVAASSASFAATSFLDSVVEGVIAGVAPTPESEARRSALTHALRSALTSALNGWAAFPSGSSVTRTYLPTSDLDVTLFVPRGTEEGTDWVVRVTEALCRTSGAAGAASSGSSGGAGPLQATDVEFINAGVRLVRCNLGGGVISADISCNSVAAVAAAALLERADDEIGSSHLFKRSLLLVKAWLEYDAPRLLASETAAAAAAIAPPIEPVVPTTTSSSSSSSVDADGGHGGIGLLDSGSGGLSSYGLAVLLLSLFNAHPRRIATPLQCLALFLEEFADFLWGTHIVSAVHRSRHAFLPQQPHAEHAHTTGPVDSPPVTRWQPQQQQQQQQHQLSAAQLQHNRCGDGDGGATCGRYLSAAALRQFSLLVEGCSNSNSSGGLLEGGAAEPHRRGSSASAARRPAAHSTASSSTTSGWTATSSAAPSVVRNVVQRSGAVQPQPHNQQPHHAATLPSSSAAAVVAPAPFVDVRNMNIEDPVAPGVNIARSVDRAHTAALTAALRAGRDRLRGVLQLASAGGEGATAAAAAALSGLLARSREAGLRSPWGYNNNSTLRSASPSSSPATSSAVSAASPAASTAHALIGRDGGSSGSSSSSNSNSAWASILAGDPHSINYSAAYAALLLSRHVTAPGTAAMVASLLAATGSIPVGEAGKLLQELLGTPTGGFTSSSAAAATGGGVGSDDSLSGVGAGGGGPSNRVRDSFGGLKRFLESVQSGGHFILGRDHPFNPMVALV